jgi:hypothetical protein
MPRFIVVSLLHTAFSGRYPSIPSSLAIAGSSNATCDPEFTPLSKRSR